MMPYEITSPPKDCAAEAALKAALLQKGRDNLALIPPAFFERHSRPAVTVVMLSYGRLERTIQAIEALKAHVVIPFKLLLIDNNSEAEVKARLREVSAACGLTELILLDENLGCAGGRRFALPYVETEYVMFVDNDIEVFPGTVEHLLFSLESQPGVVAAAGQVIFPTGLLHLCGGNYRVKGGVLFYELLGWGKRFGAPEIGESGLCEWVNGGLTALRTEFLKNHPYDLTMRGYYEDLEWCHRLNREGAGSFYRCVEAVALHHHEPKLPDPGLPEAVRRRQSLEYIEAIAGFYHLHGHVIQNVFDFAPELGSATDRRGVLSAKLVLALINAYGGDWFLSQWEQGRLDLPSLAGTLLAKLEGREEGEGVASAQVAQPLKAREAMTALLAEQQRQTGLLLTQVAARESQIARLERRLSAQAAERQKEVEQLAGRLAAEAAEKDRIERTLSAQAAEQSEKICLLAGQVTERQKAVESLSAQVTEQQRKINSLVAHVAERQRAVETLAESRLFRILSSYWRVRSAARRARQMGYLAFRRLLRGLVAYRWRRQIIKSARRPVEFAWRANLRLCRVVVKFSALLPKSINLALALQMASKDVPVLTHSPSRLRSVGTAPPAPDAGESPDGSPMATYDVFCFPVIDWEFRFQRPQQLLTQFARAGHRVFYLRTTFHQLGDRPLVREIAARVTGVQLPGPATLNLYQHEISEFQVEHFIRALDEYRLDAGITAALILVQLPFWHPLAEAARARWGWKVIYDCMDEHSGFSTNTPAMLEQEEELIRSSDLVLATARPLYDKTARLARRTLLLPNAADFDHFSHPGPDRLLAHLSGPIIGYYGAISDWFDVEMVRAAAAARPGWQFVLIGDTFGADVESLRTLANVHLLGEQPYASLPGYLDRFDVACIPFLLTPLTQATNPVKFYEYLSVGKPVVSVELPELEPFRDYFYPVRCPADFVPQIEAALAEHSPAPRRRRIDFARQQTWQARYKALGDVVPELFGQAAIIIVSYNNLEYLQLCLESIWAKTEYPNYRVIVVDNGSQPEVVDYLVAAARRESRLKVVLNGRNLGFSAANNVGVREADGCEYVVLLNNDTVVTRGWLTRMVRYLDNPAVGLVGPVTNSIGNEARINVAYQDLEGLHPFADAYTRLHTDEAFDIAVLAMYCVGVRKAVLDQIGPLDERFGVGMFEDDDYSLRVRRAGYRVVCAEDIFIHHWGGASFKQLDQDYYDRIFAENLRKFEEKWGEKWQPHRYRAGVSS
jgi:GT2 family glycosyltransferase/glycosyltransferase involved in cell wall biosynthesis